MTTYGSDLLGTLGTLTMGISGGDHPGEVRVRLRDGISECLVAYCRQPIPAGWDVLVVNARGPRSVDVEPWSLGTGAALDSDPASDQGTAGPDIAGSRSTTVPDTTVADTTGPDTAGPDTAGSAP